MVWMGSLTLSLALDMHTERNIIFFIVMEHRYGNDKRHKSEAKKGEMIDGAVRGKKRVIFIFFS
jgi:hypothetical protein